MTETEIAQAHTIADLSDKTARLRRAGTHADAMLADALVALADGRADLATEYVERARSYLAAGR